MSGPRVSSCISLHKLLLLSLFFFRPAAGLIAQTATPAPTSSPSPAPQATFLPVNTKWQLGFTVLKDRQLAQQNKYLCYSLPLLVKDALQAVSSHRLSAEELTVYRQQVRDAELAALQKKLDTLKETRDKQFYNKSIKKTEELDSNAEEKEREELIKQIHEVAGREPTAILLPDQVELAVKINHAETDQLFTLPPFSLLEFAKINKIDLFVWGELEEIQDYLYLRIGLFNTLLGKTVVDFEYAAMPDKIYELVPEIVDVLVPHILGRPWAALVINPEPADSTIEINDEVKGLGLLKESFLEPGEYKVKVTRAGYAASEQTVTLASGEKKEIAVQLEEADFKTFSVETNPPEAAVYLNSLWQGKSPLELRLAELPQSLILKKEGYRDLRVQLEETSPPLLHYTLQKDIYDLNLRQEQKRDEFYLSLGLFALSLPIPFVFYNYQQDISLKLRAFTGAEYDEALDRYTVYSYVCAGGVFLSVSLFVNLFIDLVEYIQATDRLQG